MTDAIASAQRLTAVAEESDSGDRVDRFLARRLPELSRSRILALIKAGGVANADGQLVASASAKVKAGDVLIVTVPEAEPASAAAEPIPLSIVYEDGDVIVINKPAGLVVHPAAGHASGTLVNALIAHCGASLSGIGGARRPGIVHRLDKNTSGLLVVAKNDLAHRDLAAQFAAHGRDGRLERTYRALAWGIPEPAKGTISARLVRSANDRTKIAVTRRDIGREAVTHYAVETAYRRADGKPLASDLRLVLETGRTHQIRVHLAHIGHPVIGDPLYGAHFKASLRTLGPSASEVAAHIDRQMLHAATLGFTHQRTGRTLVFSAELPPDMAALKAALERDQITAVSTVAAPDTRRGSRARRS